MTRNGRASSESWIVVEGTGDVVVIVEQGAGVVDDGTPLVDDEAQERGGEVVTTGLLKHVRYVAHEPEKSVVGDIPGADNHAVVRQDAMTGSRALEGRQVEGNPRNIAGERAEGVAIGVGVDVLDQAEGGASEARLGDHAA